MIRTKTSLLILGLEFSAHRRLRSADGRLDIEPGIDVRGDSSRSHVDHGRRGPRWIWFPLAPLEQRDPDRDVSGCLPAGSNDNVPSSGHPGRAELVRSFGREHLRKRFGLVRRRRERRRLRGRARRSRASGRPRDDPKPGGTVGAAVGSPTSLARLHHPLSTSWTLAYNQLAKVRALAQRSDHGLASSADRDKIHDFSLRRDSKENSPGGCAIHSHRALFSLPTNRSLLERTREIATRTKIAFCFSR